MGNDNATSLTLLGRLRANEPDAWARMVRIYGPLVAYWAGRAGVTGADAEDVAQDVFREVAGGIAGYQSDRPGGTFRGWLRGVTRNVLLRHARAAAGGPLAKGGTEALAGLHAIPDAGGDPTEGEDDPPSERTALYRRALELVRGEFEANTWRMFWAATVDARRPAEVAADLGVTAAAVRQAKSRVLRRLYEEVGDLIE